MYVYQRGLRGLRAEGGATGSAGTAQNIKRERRDQRQVACDIPEERRVSGANERERTQEQTASGREAQSVGHQ